MALRMSDADFELSMRISPRARNPEDNDRLRDLHVHRLSDTHKAVGRAPLRGNRVSIFCENCLKWISALSEFPLEWDCPHCGRSYRAELIVYEEVEVDDEPPASPDAQGST